MAKKKTAAVAVAANDEHALFNGLLGDAAAKSTDKPKQKDETLPITDQDGIKLLESWAASTVASKVLGDQAKGDASAFKEYALGEYCRRWKDLGGKPPNPTFSSGQASGCLQVKAPIAIRVPENSTVKKQLVQAGLPAKAADGLEAVIESKANLNIRGLHDLLAGTVEEREAAAALMKTIREHLNADQLKLVLVSEQFQYVEPDKLFNAISTHCKTAEQIEAALTVLSPTLALSSPKHTDALGVTQERLNKAKDAFEAAQADKVASKKK